MLKKPVYEPHAPLSGPMSSDDHKEISEFQEERRATTQSTPPSFLPFNNWTAFLGMVVTMMTLIGFIGGYVVHAQGQGADAENLRLWRGSTSSDISALKDSRKEDSSRLRRIEDSMLLIGEKLKIQLPKRDGN